VSQAPPSTIDELLRLNDRYDGLTPEIVLRAARRKTSPLHRHFDWDDTVAAEHWRLDQARHLIGRFRVQVVGDREPRKVRAFIHVPDEGRWRDVESVRSSPVRMQSVLDAAQSELLSFRRKYDGLLSAADLHNVVSAVFDTADA